MRLPRLHTLVSLGLLAGCAFDAAPADPSVSPECAAAVDALFAAGPLDTAESDARSAEVAAACDVAGEAGFGASDDKADGAGTGTWVEAEWYARGHDCYEERDLDCLEGNFRFLVWVWRYYEGYPHAARAMEKFIDCETEDMPLTEAEYFGAPSSPGSAFDESAPQPWQLPTKTSEDLRARLSAGSLAFDREVTLDPLLVVSQSEDIRYTLGRTMVARTARFVRASGPDLQFEARFTFRDAYDFHPDRRDVYSGGQTYAQVYPYHAWGALLVDEGRACPFVVTGDYTRSVAVTP